MPVWQLDEHVIFPAPEMADPDGLLAIGGDMRPERLLLAYRSGIFPWFRMDNEPFWFSPDPRCVLTFDALKISGSMKQLLKRNKFRVTVDEEFQTVIQACAATPRKYDSDTWIDDIFVAAYCALFDQGIAHSIEVWEEDKLAGGLYGLSIGGCFFGESMFSHVSNSSKYGFIRLAEWLQAHNYAFIDCQVYNDHLGSLGAVEIDREEFLIMLKQGLTKQPDVALGRMVLDQGASR